jgi:hypothetical protein
MMNCTKDTKATDCCEQDEKNQQVKDIPPCCTSAFSEEGEPGWTSCCESGGTNFPVMRMMQNCLRKCRWIPFFLATLGGIALTMSFYLSAEMTRVVWMVFSGLVIAGGTLGFSALSIMARKIGVCTAKP